MLPDPIVTLPSIGCRSVVKVTSLDGGIARQNDSTGIGIETSVSMNGPMGTQTLDVTIFIKQFYSSTTAMNNWKNLSLMCSYICYN